MTMSKFHQAQRRITKAKDFRADVSMYMQPHVNWEMHLTSAPISIALLGELIHISATDDFSINKNAPKDGFKFIRYPESFKACLLQVCNAGWRAFNEAHKNMDQIRLYTSQVPEYIKNSVEILVQEDTGLVKAFLPSELQKIEDISTECLKLAIATEEKYTDVIRLMEEFVEALVNAGQGYNVELEEIKNQIEIQKMRKTLAEEEKKVTEEAYKKSEKELTEATDNYKKVMDSLPSGWGILGMKLLSTISEQVIPAISIYKNPIEATIFNTGLGVVKSIPAIVQAAGTSTTSQESPKEEDQVNQKISTNKILSQSALLVVLSVPMKEFYNENGINWSQVNDQKKEAPKSDYLKKIFEETKQHISKEVECPIKNEALDICNKGINICTELAKYAPKGECDDAKTKELIEAIKDLNSKAQTFDSKSKASTGHPPFSVEPPHSSRQQSNESLGKDAFEIPYHIARLHGEQSEFLLKQVTERYDKDLDKLENARKKLDDIVKELRNLEPKEIDFKKKIEMLAKGLEAMGQVKEQWEKLVLLFQMISNIIKTVLTRNLKDFNQTVDIAGKTSYSYAQYVKDQIYTYALKASASAYVVNMISTTYTEVSSQYLMDNVSTLGRLMTMDPKRNEFTVKMEKLRQDCTSAEQGIRGLAAKSKEDFKLRCQNRITEIKAVLDEVLPPISEEEKRKLKEAVKKGIELPIVTEEKIKPAAELKPMTQEDENQFY